MYRYGFQATIFLQLLGKKKKKQGTFEPEMLIQDKFPLQCGSPQTRAAVNRAREYRASSPVTFGHSGLNGSAVPDKTHMGTDSPPTPPVPQLFPPLVQSKTHTNAEQHSA